MLVISFGNSSITIEALSFQVITMQLKPLAHKSMAPNIMKITCFIEYKIDPFKLEQFAQYAENWGDIIPAYGGELLGYFLPHEGTNDTAFGLISFDSLAHYERYRDKLKTEAAGKANFQLAKQGEFILSEKRSFLKPIAKTYQRAAETKL